VQAFRLIPFQAEDLPKIGIAGEIERAENRLLLRYAVTGDIESILLPAPSSHPSRNHDLWKMTCFEFFIAAEDRPRYWEFNMSPSGDWNVYTMDTYRQVNMRQEMLMKQIQFQVKKDADEIELIAIVDLNLIVEAGQSLNVGITAVIQTKEGKESYWALTHPGAQADFHLRESFVLAL
jgi:hypothetical protein